MTFFGRDRLKSADWPWILLLVCVSCALYANSTGGSFVDDDYFRWKYTDWIEGRSFASLAASLLAPVPSTLYRPVPYLLHMIDFRIWGPNPLGFHLTNMFLHVVAVLLVFFISRRLLNSRLGALAVSLVFAAHPVHTEAVTYIAGRADVVMAVFTLLSFLLYTRSRTTAGSRIVWSRLGSVIAFALALMSKASAIALPLLLVLYEVGFRPAGRNRKRWYGPLVALAPFVAVGAAYLAYSAHAGPMAGAGLEQIGLTTQALTASRTLYGYLRILVYPVNLTLAHGFTWSRSVSDPNAWPAIAVACLTAVALWLFYRHSRIAFFGLGWIVLSILPISNLVAVFEAPLFAERYIYAASFGFCLLLGYAFYGVYSLSRRLGRASAFRGIGVALLVLTTTAYGDLTVSRNRDWQSQDALTLKTLEQNPDVVEPYIVLGRTYLEAGSVDQALAELQKAIAIDSCSVTAQYYLGAAYRCKGWYAQAIEAFTKVTELDPDSAPAHYDLGVVCLSAGRPTEAARHFSRALAIDPGHPAARVGLGNAYYGAGQVEMAIDTYKAAAKHTPRRAEPHIFLGNTYMAIGRADSATSEYERALAINPDLYEIRVNLGKAYVRLGRFDKAIFECKRALAARPHMVEAHRVLSIAYSETGNQRLAEYHLAQASRYCPGPHAEPPG